MIAFNSLTKINRIHLDEIDSTNNFLKELSRSEHLNEFTTVTTDHQTSGRGQRGNTWESAARKNLLFSFILHPHFLEARLQFYISQIISLAIKDCLEEYTSDISIKWPNDIYWKKKKICGILIEHALTGSNIEQSIIGVGLNINQQAFYSDAPNPISLFQIIGKEIDNNHLLLSILQRAQYYYAFLQEEKAETITQHYHASLFNKEGSHCYKEGSTNFKATLVEVKPDGELILQHSTGEKKGYRFKEVQFIID